MDCLLPEKTHKDLVNLLSNYPYRESAMAISALMQLKKVGDEAEVKPKK